MQRDWCPRPVVLVIDDDQGVHAALRLVLEEDYEVVSAFDGDEGLDLLERRRVDLVLLDLLMPKTDGWQVFEQLRERHGGRPKVIFLTGVSSSTVAVAAMKLGADDWIVKPFEEPALLMQIRSLLPARQPVVLTGGNPGIRASVAVVLLARCGIPVDYTTPVAGYPWVVPIGPGHDEMALASTLSRPPMGLVELSSATRATLYRVSRSFAEASVATLATTLDLTGNYLSERFRREIGFPLGEYIVRVRVEVLKQRLCEPSSPPLEQLAEEVGFCHSAHLSRAFDRYANVSPGLYRRKMQRDRGNVH